MRIAPPRRNRERQRGRDAQTARETDNERERDRAGERRFSYLESTAEMRIAAGRERESVAERG